MVSPPTVVPSPHLPRSPLTYLARSASCAPRHRGGIVGSVPYALAHQSLPRPAVRRLSRGARRLLSPTTRSTVPAAPPRALDAAAPWDAGPSSWRDRLPRPSTSPSAWTDPSAIDHLAADCNFRLPHTPERSQRDPLSCATDLDPQACAYEHCTATVGLPCRHQCVRTCVDCDLRCRAECAACRASCRGPRCPRTCATACGRCLQACIGAQDRCVTAGCTTQYEACAVGLIRHFRDDGCAAECARCEATCPRRSEGDCFDACLAGAHACTPQEASLCEEHGSGYGQEYLRWHDARAADASP